MISYFEGRSDLDDILLTDPDLHLQKIFHQLWFGDGESIRVKVMVMVMVCEGFTYRGFTYRYILRISVIIIIMSRFLF